MRDDSNTTEAGSPDPKSDTKSADLRKLENAMDRFVHQVRLSRGHGARQVHSLLLRVRKGEVTMDQRTADELTDVLESTGYAVADAQAEIQRAKRQPWRI